MSISYKRCVLFCRSFRPYSDFDHERGAETFISKEERSLVKSPDISDNDSAICFVIPGHIDGAYPQTKPRKADRVKIVDARGVMIHESEGYRP